MHKKHEACRCEKGKAFPKCEKFKISLKHAPRHAAFFDVRQEGIFVASPLDINVVKVYNYNDII